MVKEGYKQTEIGVIPEDWEVRKLGEILSTIIGGGTPSRSIKEYWNGNIPWKTVKDFTTFNPYKTQEYITIEGVKNSATRIVPAGNLIIATRIALGKIVNYKVDIAINQDLKMIELNPTVDSVFFIYKYRFLEEKIIEKGSGSTVLGLSINDLKGFIFSIPPLPEQEAIATALSDCDTWIESLEQLLVKKRLIKQGAMQELLTPKEDWEVKKLGDVCDVFRGGSPRPIQDYLTNALDGVNWIKIGDTSSSEKYITSAKEKIIPEGEKNSRKVFVGDFLLSNSMSFGRPYILKIEGCIHDGWLVLQNYKETFTTEFLFYMLTSKSILDQYKSKAAGSSVLNLNKEIVSSVDVSIPSLSEQERIAGILSDMDAELEALEKQISKAREIKQGMMQELLTGKVRLV